MARVWGAWTPTSGGVTFRLGFDYTLSGNTIKVSQYVAESNGYVQDNVVLTRTGVVGGAMSWLFSRSSAGVSAIPNSGFNYTGAYGKSYTVGGRLSDMVYNHSPSVSANISIPAGTPSAPGTPTYTNVSPTSVTVNWAAPSNTGGSAILEYAVARSIGSTVNTTEVTILTGSTSRSRSFTGLTPGEQYTFRIRARNGVNWGAWGSPSTVRMQYGVWVLDSGIWKLAAPFVKHNDAWKPAIPMVLHNGVWKPTS